MPRDPPADPPGSTVTPQRVLHRRIQAPLSLLGVMHVLQRVEEGHEAAYILSRVAKNAHLDEPERARMVVLTHAALRSLNRLDRAVGAATGTKAAELVAWERQFCRVAALLGERGERLDDLLPWAAAHTHPSQVPQAHQRAHRAARDAAHFLTTPRRDDVRDLAVRTGHPEWFAGLALRLLGREASALLESNNVEPQAVVRVNTLKATREELILALSKEGLTAHATRLSPWGVVIQEKAGLFRSQAFKDGLFEMQDEGSQLVGAIVGARPGQSVLDACAGAGGKTLHLGAEMNNKGRLVACDISAPRLTDLRRRCGRAGVMNYEAFVVDASCRVVGNAKAMRRGDATPPAALPVDSFDRILVDAPCSGLGTARRTPEIRWKMTPERLPEYPPRQRAILDAWAPKVAPGGRLVYATCTFDPAEGEEVAAGFLRDHPEFRALPVENLLPEQARGRGVTTGDGHLRLWPHRHGTEGFFAAVLERADAGPSA